MIRIENSGKKRFRGYRPPSTRASWSLILLGSLLGTLGVFLVLPMTQLVSTGVQRELEILKVDAVVAPPPPAVELEEPPPPQEPEESDPVPELSEQSLPLSLGDLDLDISVGAGGAFGKVFNFAGEQSLTEVAIFDLADLERRPRAVSRVPPRYPAELKRAKIEGSVVLLFVLDENGRVQDPQVESSTQPEFERPALTAIRRWRFQPGTRDGKPVRSYVRQQIAFRLD